MAVKKSFSFIKFIIFILVAVGIAVYVNLNKNGSLKDTKLGNYLKSIYLYDATETSIQAVRQGVKWSQKNVPAYYAVVADASRPHVKVFLEYATVVFNHVKKSIGVVIDYVVEKLPIIGQWLDSYVPGLNSKELLSSASRYAEIFVQYFTKFATQVFAHIGNGIVFLINWLQQNVFVGNLSSENIQKFAGLGINATCKFAAETYVWVQDKFIALYS